MVNRSMVLGAALASLMACSAQGGMGGGGGLLPPEDAGGGGGGGSCSTLCARQAMANCPRFNMGECVSTCMRFTGIAACASQANAVLRCGATATFTCDGDGDPTAAACNMEATAFTLCALSGLSDGGVDVSVSTD